MRVFGSEMAGAAGLLASLPQPKHSSGGNARSFKAQETAKKKEEEARTGPLSAAPPPYGEREKFVPRRREDFGDGGAFPEIHVPQYPRGLGHPDAVADAGEQRALALTVDADGEVRYDAIVGGGSGGSGRLVYHSHSQLVPKVDQLKDDMERPGKEEEDEVARRTAAALEKRVQSKLSTAQPSTVAPKPAPSQYIKYTPATNYAGSAGNNTRIIKMTEAPQDPFEPPKFRHRRVPRGPGSPPVPVMHSPPRNLTAEDQKDWQIPPCVSKWKNTRGYTIPLDKRMAADARGLQDVTINDNFAKLSESLYVAEQTARKAVEMRSKIQRELMVREKEKKEETLRELAQKARVERAGAGAAAATAGGGGFTASVGGGTVGGDDDGLDGSPQDVGFHSHRGRNGGDGAQPMAPPATDDGNMRFRETEDERRERLRREEIREERRKEREHERRMEAKGEHLNKRSKITRDRDRDVSERIALGQANIKASGEAMYDQRLFNQDGGLGSGYNQEDAYNLYDKALFADRGSNLYNPKGAADGEAYGGGAAEDDKNFSTARFRPDKGFSGADGKGNAPVASAGPRSQPVEFEMDGDDPFGLDKFMTEVKTGKSAVDKIGSRGTMHAAGGGSGQGFSAADNRRIDFQK